MDDTEELRKTQSQNAESNSFQNTEENTAGANNLFMPKSTLKVPSAARDELSKVKPLPPDDRSKTASPNTHQSAKPAKKQPGRMSKGSSSNAFQDLEDKLAKELNQNTKQTARKSADSIARAARFSISRKYAYPVEHTIEVYNNPSTDLYDVLGVKASISDADLRKVYRARVLEVHPGWSCLLSFHPTVIVFIVVIFSYSVIR